MDGWTDRHDEVNSLLNLLENRHDIGLMEDIMNTVHITGKGRLMDTLEKFYIF